MIASTILRVRFTVEHGSVRDRFHCAHVGSGMLYEDVITHGGAVMTCCHEGQGSYSSSRTASLLYDQLFDGNL